MEYSCNDRSTSIRDLPEDCLFIIFSWLKSSIDRDSFGLTCRRWLRIQSLGRRSLQLATSFTSSNQSIPCWYHPPDINAFNLNKLLTRFRQLTSLSLSGCTEIPDSGLTSLQYFGSKLQTLYLDCCFKISDNGLSHVAFGCPSLTSISLYRCSITDFGLEILSKSCSALKNVNLSYCSTISDSGIRALSHKCRQLKAIRVSYCCNITGVGFNGCSPTLSYLEADSCKLQPQGILDIVSGGGLEYLNVSSLIWSIHGDGLAGIGSGFGSRLRVLNLRMCRSVNDESIVAISHGCPVLREWNVALCHEIRVLGWEGIAKNCHKLEVLHVNRCRNLCDLGLQALQGGCKGLLVLYIHGCHRITSRGMHSFKWQRSKVKIKKVELMSIGPTYHFIDNITY